VDENLEGLLHLSLTNTQFFQPNIKKLIPVMYVTSPITIATKPNMTAFFAFRHYKCIGFMGFSFPRHFVPDTYWMIRCLNILFYGRFIPLTFHSLDVLFHW